MLAETVVLATLASVDCFVCLAPFWVNEVCRADVLGLGSGYSVVCFFYVSFTFLIRMFEDK